MQSDLQSTISSLCLPTCGWDWGRDWDTFFWYWHTWACTFPPPSLPPCPPSSFSGPQQFLDKVARHTVEEEAQHDQQQQGQHNLYDQPLVAVAHQVADGFQRAQEPQEGGVWAAS